jgi:hypothetical protein
MMGYWIIDRLRCYFRGHRDLSRIASYAAVQADGRIRELHFCLACGSLVWTSNQQRHRPITWNDLQL